MIGWIIVGGDFSQIWQFYWMLTRFIKSRVTICILIIISISFNIQAIIRLMVYYSFIYFLWLWFEMIVRSRLIRRFIFNMIFIKLFNILSRGNLWHRYNLIINQSTAPKLLMDIIHNFIHIFLRFMMIYRVVSFKIQITANNFFVHTWLMVTWHIVL